MGNGAEMEAEMVALRARREVRVEAALAAMNGLLAGRAGQAIEADRLVEQSVLLADRLLERLGWEEVRA